MLSIGDIHVFVSDFPLAMRFYGDGLGLTVVEHEPSPASPFAVLEFPDGGPAIRLFGGAEAWRPGERLPAGTRPTVRFDVATDDFDGTLARLMENGGEQVDEVEEYDGLRVVTVADPDGNSLELVEVPS
jgi:predicted enzyme related to lactoylglutathione lyase